MGSQWIVDGGAMKMLRYSGDEFCRRIDTYLIIALGLPVPPRWSLHSCKERGIPTVNLRGQSI